MAEGQEVRTLDDLDRAVRALATHFNCDTTVIVGSQATLVGWPDAPILFRTSPEIDAYPGNAREWEAERRAEGHDIEASEEIFARFGQGSSFHHAHGFYIDGVDEGTAKLPPGWKSRAVTREVEVNGIIVRAIAPAMTDLIVSKLLALRDKDKEFIREYHRIRHLDRAHVRRLLIDMLIPEAQRTVIGAFLDSL